MRDMHRERLTHLLANAILELWKKETGSLSSVLIEGTICITSSTGKTTVLQVADRFTGSIPEADEQQNDHNFSPPDHMAPAGLRTRYNHPANFGVIRSLSLPHCYPEPPPRVDCHNQAAMATFLDNLSPASLVSPGTEYSRCSLERKSPFNHGLSIREVNNNHPLDHTEMGKDEALNYGSVDRSSSSSEAQTGGICAGTGYYTTQELNNNTIEVKHPLKFHKGRPQQTSPDRNKRHGSRDRSPTGDNSSGSGDRKRSSSEPVHIHASKSPSPDMQSNHGDNSGDRIETLEGGGPQDSDAMDLTRKSLSVKCVDDAVVRRYADDLALSPPHSYTAQVRDIIRQRVLAAQHKGGSTSSSDLEAEGHFGDGRDGGKVTPKVLESLGLHRSEEDDESASEFTRRIRQDSTASEPAGHPLPPSSLHDEPLRVSVYSKRPQAHHPLLLGAVSPIGPGSPHLSTAPSTSSPLTSPGGPGSNGHLHSILQQHRLFLPLPPLSRGGMSSVTTGPSSAPPLFTHPGFSPLQLPPGAVGPRETSPSPTDLSLDSSGEGDKEAGGEQRVYRCEFCTKTFLFKSKYHEHLPVHTNARPFQCHLCSRTYKYKYDLRVHLRTHMGIPTKSTVCPFCNTKFDTNKRLRVHIKDAHKDKQKAGEEDPGAPLVSPIMPPGPPTLMRPPVEARPPAL